MAGKSSLSIKPFEDLPRQVLAPIYDAFPPEASDITWVNLWIWRKQRPLFVHRVEDTFQFLEEFGKERFRLFGPPLGPLPLEDILPTLPVPPEGMVRGTTRCLKALWNSGYRTVCMRENADYIYSIEDLATLAGGRYARKRQLIHHLENTHDCEYRTMTLEEVPAVRLFYHECLQEYALESFESEQSAGEELFSLLPSIPFRGGILLIDGMMAAFIIGEVVAKNSMVAHIGKSRHEPHGAFALLLHRFVQRECADLSLLNFEQDLGIPGLRIAKERFYPRYQILKWAGTKN